MYALCLESSNIRGMGHLFRGLNFYRFLKQKREDVIVFINNDRYAIRILQQGRIFYEVINYEDIQSNWESKLIDKYKIHLWLNDKYQTKRELYLHVKSNKNVVLAAIDEESENADLLDIHFVGMVFQKDFIPKGKYVFQGIEYIILNEEIRKYRRVRTEVKRIIVSMGGSDTYGVTVKVLKILKDKKIPADIVIGPSFEHKQELSRHLTEDYCTVQNVESLIEKFSEYDLAITGGGVTCFEAAASGMPCIIIANELFEVETAQYMERLGAAVFAGYHEQICEKDFCIDGLDIEKMSRFGIRNIPLNGVQNIYERIQGYIGESEWKIDWL